MQQFQKTKTHTAHVTAHSFSISFAALSAHHFKHTPTACPPFLKLISETKGDDLKLTAWTLKAMHTQVGLTPISLKDIVLKSGINFHPMELYGLKRLSMLFDFITLIQWAVIQF